MFTLFLFLESICELYVFTVNWKLISVVQHLSPSPVFLGYGLRLEANKLLLAAIFGEAAILLHWLYKY